MEKFVEVAVSNEKEKVSNQLHISNNLVFPILSKLSLKSSKRFGCVHKSWALLSENPNFISMYRNNFISYEHSYYNDTSLLLQRYVPDSDLLELYSLSSERFVNKVKLDWSPQFEEDGLKLIDILGCGGIKGILCLSQEGITVVYLNRFVLWNPTTKDLKVIPPSPIEYVPPYREALVDFHGFGYDHVRDDYKVIQCVIFFPMIDEETYVPFEDRPFDPLLEMYSLRSNSWKKLDVDIPNCYYDEPIIGVYMDGVRHWWGRSAIDNVEERLVSLDFSNGCLPMPSEMDDSLDFGFVERHLVVLNESIALISNNSKATTFHISILGEFSVSESWIKLFILGPLPCVEHPIGAGKKCDIFFWEKNGELVWFDLSTQMIEELGVKRGQFSCQVGFYKENLLPFGGTIN